MTIVAGVVSLSEAPPADMADRLAAAAGYRPELHLGLRYDTSQLSTRVLAPSIGGGRSIQVRTVDGEEVLLIGHPVCTDGSINRLRARLRESAEWTLENLDGHWLAVLHHPHSGRVRLRSDRIGAAWLYVARDGDRYLFCSHFGALVGALSFQPRLDVDSALAMLALNYTPDGGTCFREISALPHGRFVELTDSGLSHGPAPVPNYGDRFAGLDEATKFQRLDDLYDRAMASWCGPRESECTVSLSSGYDSRYALGLLVQRGARPKCITFGQPRSRDVSGSKALCRRLGLKHSVYEIRDSDWQAWREHVQRLGNVGGFQFSSGWARHWLRELVAAGPAVLIGYLGDALSGKHLVRYHGDDWAANWEAWSLDEGRSANWVNSPLLHGHIAQRYRATVRARLDQVMAQPAQVAFPHQRAMHADLFGRQRRLVAAQTNIIADALDPIPFFYTQELVEFWANLGYSDLERQRLYRRYAEVRFTAVFPPVSKPGIGRRIWGSGVNAIGSVAPGLRRRLAPAEIDLVQLLGRHRAAIAVLARRLEPMLEELFDVRKLIPALERFPTDPVINPMQLQRLTNLMLLLDNAMAPAGAARPSSAAARAAAM